MGILALIEVQQVRHSLVLDLLLEQRGELLAQDLRVLQGEPEVLGERTFARAEEAGDPDADLFVQAQRVPRRWP